LLYIIILSEGDKNMYDKIPIFLGAIILLMGIFMAVSPKNAAKKEFRENENELQKVRKSGFIMIVCGIITIVIGVL
jgi:uncharacterized membrane protein YfcA